MYKIINLFVFLSILLTGFCLKTYSQKNKSKALKHYLVHINYLVKDGGKWKTDNIDFNALEDSSANYYLIEYTKGANEYTLNFKLKGYVVQKTKWITFQEGFYKWDDVTKKILYHGLYPDYEEVNGESQIITAKKMAFKHNFSSPVAREPAYQTTTF